MRHCLPITRPRSQSLPLTLIRLQLYLLARGIPHSLAGKDANSNTDPWHNTHTYARNNPHARNNAHLRAWDNPYYYTCIALTVSQQRAISAAIATSTIPRHSNTPQLQPAHASAGPVKTAPRLAPK